MTHQALNTDMQVSSLKNMKLFGMIYHQFYHEDNIRGSSYKIQIPHYKLWEKLGARFHNDNKRNCLVFRFARFTITVTTTPFTYRTYLKISLPFIRNDMGIRFWKNNSFK